MSRQLLELLDETTPLPARKVAERLGWTLSRTREVLRELKGDGLTVSDHRGWRRVVGANLDLGDLTAVLVRLRDLDREAERCGREETHETWLTANEVRWRVLRLADDEEELAVWLHEPHLIADVSPVETHPGCDPAVLARLRRTTAALLTALGGADRPVVLLRAAVGELAAMALERDLRAWAVPW